MRSALILFLVALVTAALAGAALAAQQPYRLDWWTVDGGGSLSTGGDYSLRGTFAQPDAGPSVAGGNFQLEGGFWGGALSGDTTKRLFLPMVAGL